LHKEKSGIEWKHEGFGHDKSGFPAGIAVRGEPALCPAGPAAVVGANNGRFDNEAGRCFQGDSDEGKIRRRDKEASHGDSRAQ
jgi:hypothetical protein